MAQFRATLHGNKGVASRLGTKASGIEADINGWDLGIRVTGRHDQELKTDIFNVTITSGSNRHGTDLTVFEVRKLVDGELEITPGPGFDLLAQKEAGQKTG